MIECSILLNDRAQILSSSLWSPQKTAKLSYGPSVSRHVWPRVQQNVTFVFLLSSVGVAKLSDFRMSPSRVLNSVRYNPKSDCLHGYDERESCRTPSRSLSWRGSRRGWCLRTGQRGRPRQPPGQPPKHSPENGDLSGSRRVRGGQSLALRRRRRRVTHRNYLVEIPEPLRGPGVRRDPCDRAARCSSGSGGSREERQCQACSGVAS